MNALKEFLDRADVPAAFFCASPGDWEKDCIIYEGLREFCNTFLGMFLLSGKSGAGKTHAACCCIAQYAFSGKTDARFVNISDLYVQWLSSAKDGKSVLDLLEKYGEKELLVLDDLGTRTPTDGFLDFLYLMINRRVNRLDLGTIVTTNLTSYQMLERMGDAITGRLANGKILKFIGPDKRFANN